jgi:DNA-binding NtrC family response regulator
LIHRAGPRPEGPFLDVNCSAIPESLVERELFGHEPGSFTDARRGTSGAFQTANQGTLYLDNVTMAEGFQAKLLKVIEKRSVRRVGSMRDEPVDVWILMGTYDDLRAEVDYHRKYREAFDLHKASFIEELYQHLGQLDLLIPPLRQRPDDILLLAEHFLACACAEHHLLPKSFAPDARSAMLTYTWPGNVREVEHVTERVALRFAKRNIITAARLALPEW